MGTTGLLLALLVAIGEGLAHERAWKAISQLEACAEFGEFRLAYRRVPDWERDAGKLPEGVFGFHLYQLGENAARSGQSQWRAIADDALISWELKADLAAQVFDALNERGEFAILIEGEAQNCKAGAAVVGHDGELFYVAGLEAWPDATVGGCAVAVGRAEWVPSQAMQSDPPSAGLTQPCLQLRAAFRACERLSAKSFERSGNPE